ncbi:MAG: ABC transporter permease subunit [Gemmatimonadota bacterium]
MDLHQIGTLYAHEVRSALRERSIVVFSILIPLVMYPALLWVAFSGISFIQGQAERITTRVALVDLPAAHSPLADSLMENSRLTLVEWDESTEGSRAALVDGRLDALVEFLPPDPEAGSLPDNFRVRISYSEVRDRSRTARRLLTSSLDQYREEWLDRERAGMGVGATEWADYAVVREDIATSEENTRFLLGTMVPFLTLIIVALAAFYPAIDATAGERERSTWETLLSSAARRGDVATAKYLYVATFGTVGGLLNLGALALALHWIIRPLAGSDADDFAGGALPLEAIPLIVAGTALLALFVAAGMLAFSIFARNFKEGQSMISPFYMLIFLPALFVQSPDVEFTPRIAMIPLVNVAVLLREAIMGSVPLVPGLLTLLTMGVCVAVAIALVQWVMRNEDVLLGATDGGLLSYLRRRIRNGASRAR